MRLNEIEPHPVLFAGALAVVSVTLVSTDGTILTGIGYAAFLAALALWLYRPVEVD